MVILIRHIRLPRRVRRMTDGPLPGGYFFALEGKNDLPDTWMDSEDTEYPLIKVSLSELLKEGCKIWIGRASANPNADPGWKEVRSEEDVPPFASEWWDDYDGCTSHFIVSPFLPQFYVLPPSSRPEWRWKEWKDSKFRCPKCGIHEYVKVEDNKWTQDHRSPVHRVLQFLRCSLCDSALSVEE